MVNTKQTGKRKVVSLEGGLRQARRQQNQSVVFLPSGTPPMPRDRARPEDVSSLQRQIYSSTPQMERTKTLQKQYLKNYSLRRNG